MTPGDPPRRGRPPRPVDPGASSAARLGAEIRSARQRRGLTQQQLARQIGFSTAHLSAVELAYASASEQFVVACEGALDAGGALLELLPAAVYERASKRSRNAARRRWGGELPMPRCSSAPASGAVRNEQHELLVVLAFGHPWADEMSEDRGVAC